MGTVTFCVAVVIDGDNEAQTAIRCVAENGAEPDEDLIIEARDEAVEYYTENVGNLPDRHRIVAALITIPEIESGMSIVKATLKQLEQRPVTIAVE